jgi:hypothetical protein
MSKTSIGFLTLAVIGAVLGTVAFFGYSPFVKVVQDTFGASPANTTFQTQKQLGVVMNLAAGTSTSVQNTTANDLYAHDLDYVCTGVGTSQTAYTGAGLASLTLKVSTTSTSLVGSTPTSNVAVTNTNTAVSTTIATGSVTTLVGSSTLGYSGSTALTEDIPAGSWATFYTNATNTAACSFSLEVTST